jgi:hypothetical protein
MHSVGHGSPSTHTFLGEKFVPCRRERDSSQLYGVLEGQVDLKPARRDARQEVTYWLIPTAATCVPQPNTDSP